ncbi:ABC transporter permease subunit [Pseudomonas sp. KNUC1026]|uniref:ABC transporter permease subunit n=1 Tax=Pseudomonas sp. KNUC1026 TaxID=2893890 RepID=UPI001F331F96|nr:ABC transporter permease subunit [Pseudomonas sp. KNUC1026]UFH51586.1 ABC transporter permease subunit [Pseudomonas sp. KNUC1026]
MLAYTLRRLVLIVPTLLIILIVNFVIVQAAPGGPVEQAIAHLQGIGGAPGATGSAGDAGGTSSRASRGLDPKLIESIKQHYGFDKSAPERLWLMLKQYAVLDFGNSFFRWCQGHRPDPAKAAGHSPLGLWATLITYLVSIPLGVRKAVRHGSHFDVWSSTAIVVGYAMPPFLLAIFLIVLFCGGTGLNWFPVRGLTSDNFEQLERGGQAGRLLLAPGAAGALAGAGGFATLTVLVKNAFLTEVTRQYVVTARAKGLTERRVLYGHIFRNAMLLVVAGLPQALITVFFAGSLLIEVVFSLDGLGRLSYEAAVARDYPVVFGTLFIFTLAGLVIKLLGDLCYLLVDPRIDFSARSA